MKPYSMDLRDRVVLACDSGVWTHAEVAEQFGVSPAWVFRLLQRRRHEGRHGPRDHGGGHPPAFSPRAIRRLEAAVERQPDATLEELRVRCGVSCSLVTIHNALNRLGYRRKKRRFGVGAGSTGSRSTTSCVASEDKSHRGPANSIHPRCQGFRTGEVRFNPCCVAHKG